MIDTTEVIRLLKVKEYSYIDDKDKQIHLGFIAHELQELVPTAVIGNKDDVDENGDPIFQKVRLPVLVPYLVSALQLALNRIDKLEEKITSLEQR